MAYEWDNKKPTAQMLGRWQPFHDGHYALFEEIIKKTGQVCIQIRDVEGVDDNPFDFGTVKKNIEEKFSHKYYNEIGLGIDFTARDIQEECQAKGMPWEKAKGFDGAAQISRSFINKSELDLNDISFLLEKNGEQVQIGNSKDMLFSFDKIIAYISKFYTLKIGDLFFTGTPAGVGKVEKGDMLKGFIGEKEMFKVVVK